MIQVVPFASPLYALAVQFRDEHLRRPLGLFLSAEDLADENRQIHIAAVENALVLGTVVLKPGQGTSIKLRQLAVAPHVRGKGIGKRLVRFGEATALQRGYAEVELSSRLSAQGFYAALGYQTIGEPFLELAVPHIKMARRIAS